MSGYELTGCWPNNLLALLSDWYMIENIANLYSDRLDPSHLTQTVRLFSNSRNDLMFLMTLGTQRQLGVSKFFFYFSY